MNLPTPRMGGPISHNPAFDSLMHLSSFAVLFLRVSFVRSWKILYVVFTKRENIFTTARVGRDVIFLRESTM